MLDNFAPIANRSIRSINRERMNAVKTMCIEIITRHALLSSVPQLHSENGCSMGRIVTRTFSTTDFIQYVFRFLEETRKTRKY